MVARPHGVHALVAHELVTLAAGFHSSIYLRAGGQTASFLASLMGSLPPMHELAANVGIRLPKFLGEVDEGHAVAPALRKLAETIEEAEAEVGEAMHAAHAAITDDIVDHEQAVDEPNEPAPPEWPEA